MNNKELPKRKKIRLKDYNYSESGYYFVTICAHERKNIFSHIVGGGAHDAPKIILSKIGQTVEKYILSTNNIPQISVDKYVIMPNHIHLILIVNNNGTSKAPNGTSKAPNGTSKAPNRTSKAPNGTSKAPNGTSKAPSPTNNIISHSVSTLKRFVNKDVGYNVFQRSFYDHIIRDENDYLNVWNYIDTNPQKWTDDCYYTEE